MTPSTTLPDLGPRYEAKAALGEGGMGLVWRALDRETGAEVALKAMRPESAGDEGAQLAFQQEFRAMARVRDAHTCQVHDYGRLPDGSPYFTMELVPGQDLKDLLPMDLEAATKVLAQVGQALGAVHQAGYVHADLKPENLRVRPDGSVKLMDFGLMSPAGQAPEAIRGTLNYMAPEAIRQDALDGRADLYALGVVAHELLSGRLPFQAEGPVALAKAHLHEAPTPLRELLPELPVGVERAVLALLAKEPQDRPATAAAALRALGVAAEAAGPAALLSPPFVGRAQELLALRTAFAEVQAQKRGGLRCLEGAEGLGKSRLLHELRTAAALDEAQAWGGVAPEEARPLGPFLAPLRAAWPHFQAHDPARAEALAPVAGALLPELLPEGAALGVDPEQLKARLVALVAEVLSAAAQAKGGALLVLDAWERADAPSQEALTELGRLLPTHPLLVVLASRSPAPVGAERVALPALKAEEVQALAGGMLGLEALPPQVGAQLVALSEGVPSAVVRLVAHLAESGALGQAEGQWVLPEALPAEALPADRKAMLLARAEALGADARELLAWAAVHGAPFELAVAREVLAWPPERLLDAVDEAQRARVLQGQGQRLAFADAHLKALLAEGVDAAQAQAWHGGIARAVGAPARQGDHAELAFWVEHTLQGDRPQEGLEAAWWLAERQCLLFLLPEAVATAEAALAIATPLGEAVPFPVRFGLRRELAMVAYRQMDLAKARALLLQLLPLAEAWEAQGELRGRMAHGYLLACVAMQEAKAASYKEVDALLPQVIAWAQAVGDRKQEALARVHWGRSAFFQGRQAEAIARLSEAAQLADQEGMPGPSGRAKAVLGHLLAMKGPQSRSQGLEALKQAGEQLRAAEDMMGLMVFENLRFETMLALGRLAEAKEAAASHEATGRRCGAVDDILIGGLNLAVALQEQGLAQPTVAQAQAVLKEANARKHEVVSAFSQAILAWGLAASGALPEAVTALAAADERLRSLSNYVFLAAYPYLVGAHLQLGNLTQAMHLVQEVQFQLRGGDDPMAELRLACTLAETYLALGNLDQAEGFAEDAVQKALATDARALLLRAYLHRAQARLLLEKPKEARADLELAEACVDAVGDALAHQRLAALKGALAREAGEWADAAKHWQQAADLAAKADAPIALALARAARSALPGAGEAGATLLSEAQKALRGMVRGLEPEAADVFQRRAEVHAALERIPGLETEEEEDAAEVTLGRLERIGADLQAVSQHYGRLLQEGRKRGDQLEGLNELATALNETLDMERVLPLVVMRTLELTKAERGFVFLADPHEADGLRLAAAFDRFGRAIPHEQASRSACHKVVAKGEPLVVMDAALDEEFQASRSVAALNLRTLMAVPLRAREEFLGVLYVDSQAVVATFTERDVRLLSAIAAHAAVAIENARLVYALQARAEELEQALELYRRAEHEASTDLLTGLRNRRAFEARAAAEVARSRRHGHALSLILLDVDHFKKFNDTYGHALGDEVLKVVGRVLPEALRVPDLPARLGGEEFAILCPDTSPEGALLVAQRIGDALRATKLHDAEGQPVRTITASLGVTAFTPEDPDVHALLARADAALYACKEAGRDRAMIWTPDMKAVPGT